LVKAIVLVKSPKKLIAARLKRINLVYESFPVSGQFDAVAVIQVEKKINGVERTETMIEVE